MIALVFFMIACTSADNSTERLPFEVTLYVRCDTGVIFYETEVQAKEGDSVFDVLLREMREAEIHMSFRTTPIINTAYVEAINNRFEFDAGPLSGWKYRVNGEFPGISPSSYTLQPGDAIEWLFSLDMGRDLE